MRFSQILLYFGIWMLSHLLKFTIILPVNAQEIEPNEDDDLINQRNSRINESEEEFEINDNNAEPFNDYLAQEINENDELPKDYDNQTSIDKNETENRRAIPFSAKLLPAPVIHFILNTTDFFVESDEATINVTINGDDDNGDTESPFDLDFPPKNKSGDSFSICFALKEEELSRRCKKAINYGGGVYIPALNNTNLDEFITYHEKVMSRNHSEPFELKYPKANFELFNSSWYTSILGIKRNHNLKVFGILSEIDNITDVFDKFSQTIEFSVFDGFLIDWEHIPTACPNNVPRLNTTLEIRYFMGHQDCEYVKEMEIEFTRDKKTRGLNIPEYLTPLFPCFDGYEGRCYKAITQNPEEACNANSQRYMFSPWNRASSAIWFLFSEVCNKLNGNVTPNDFIQSI